LRKAFFSTLEGLARKDSRIVLLTGDLGFMLIEEFAAAHPDRFFNVGVAEANMVGVATGLAAQGFIPFCYSIATFATLRPYEQIRNGPSVHELPVRIVGVGGGFGYGSAGRSHHALEDIGLARLQPELTIIGPADDAQTASAIRATYDLPGPIYYRLGKDSRQVPELRGDFALGRLQTVGDGTDALLVCNGGMALGALAARQLLQQRKLDVTVAVVSCIRPVPGDDLAALLDHHRLVISVEDHYIVGGIGSIVAETIAELGAGNRLVRLGVNRALPGRSGSESYLLAEAGLSSEAIAAAVARVAVPAASA
jgi:transketolase